MPTSKMTIWQTNKQMDREEKSQNVNQIKIENEWLIHKYDHDYQMKCPIWNVRRYKSCARARLTPKKYEWWKNSGQHCGWTDERIQWKKM